MTQSSTGNVGISNGTCQKDPDQAVIVVSGFDLLRIETVNSQPEPELSRLNAYAKSRDIAALHHPYCHAHVPR